MSYCICVMKDNPKECKVWVGYGSHMGWNSLNVKSMSSPGSFYYDKEKAIEEANELKKLGASVTIEERDDVVKMIPKKDDGEYVECDCEDCKSKRSK